MSTYDLVDRLIDSPILWIQTEEDAVTSWLGLGNRPDTDLLAITSGGCTPLTFLALGAQSVITVDVNPTQTMILELKRAAITTLSRKEVLAFLGITDITGNQERYEQLRSQLSPLAQKYWDNNTHLFTRCRLIEAGGMQGVGGELQQTRQDAYATMQTLFASNTIDVQTARFDDSAAYAVAKLRQARAEKFFGAGDDHQDDNDDVAQEMQRTFVSRLQQASQNFLFRNSPWASHMLLGRYQGPLPPYLEPTGFDRVRQKIDQLQIYTTELHSLVAELPDNSLDGADISNVSDYLNETQFQALCTAFARVLRPQGRLVHRNLIWTTPYAPAPQFVRDTCLSTNLQKMDKSFLYSAFCVDILEV